MIFLEILFSCLCIKLLFNILFILILNMSSCLDIRNNVNKTVQRMISTACVNDITNILTVNTVFINNMDDRAGGDLRRLMERQRSEITGSSSWLGAGDSADVPAMRLRRRRRNLTVQI